MDCWTRSVVLSTGGRFPLAPPLASPQVIPSDTTQNIVMMANMHIRSATRIASGHGIDGGTGFASRGGSSCGDGGWYGLSIGLSCVAERCGSFGRRDRSSIVKTSDSPTRGHPMVRHLVRAHPSKPPSILECSRQQLSCRPARCRTCRGGAEEDQSESVRDHQRKVRPLFGWHISSAMLDHVGNGRLQRWI